MPRRKRGPVASARACSQVWISLYFAISYVDFWALAPVLYVSAHMGHNAARS